MMLKINNIKFSSRKIVYGIVVLFIFFVFLLFVRIYNNKGIGGDQVHYLVMTHSLLQDYDFDLKNDYQSERYREYWDDELDPHIPVRQFGPESPEWYSLHNPGLPILISPFVKFFGNKGSLLVMISISLLMIFLTYLWTKQITKNKWCALLGTGAMLTSVFFIALNGYLFPNMLIAALFLGAMLLLEKKKITRAQFILLGFILGIGPWFHVKLLLSFATIGIIAVVQIILSKKSWNNRIIDLLALILPALVLVGLFELKLYQWYGVILPSQTFAGDIIFFVSAIDSLPAILFDATKGIFTNNPAFLLIFLGLPIWLRKSPKQILKLFLIIGPSFFLQLTFLDWWGGWSPSGRYFIDILPILMPAVGYTVLLLRKMWFKIIALILFLGQIVFSSIYVLFKSNWVWAGLRNPIFETIEKITTIQIDRFMPHFKPELKIAFGAEYLILWILLAIALFLLGYWYVRKRTLLADKVDSTRPWSG